MIFIQVFISEHPVLLVFGVIIFIWIIIHYATKNTRKSKELEIRENQVRRREDSVLTRENAVSNTERYQTLTKAQIDRSLKYIENSQTKKLAAEISQSYIMDLLKRASKDMRFEDTKVFRDIYDCDLDVLLSRFMKAKTSKLTVLDGVNHSCTMRGSNGEENTVTLNSCTCRDFTFRGSSCKHMFRLALDLALLSEADTSLPLKKLDEKLLQLRDEKEKAEASAIIAEHRIKEEHAIKRSIEEQNNALRKLLSETEQDFPVLGKMYADVFNRYYSDVQDYLLYKRNPARNAKDFYDEAKKHIKSYAKRATAAESQLLFYENLFPWLEEFKQVPIQEAVSYVSGDQGPNDEYYHLREYLSPQEYANLSVVEKYQLALDRYKKRKKSAWQIGREYERYIGYCCETQGCYVQYRGALDGLEDMGKDLIVSKENEIYVIQCKYWAKEKTLHEKHIFQLYGTTVLLKLEHGEAQVIPVFVTSASLSDTARDCAQFLNITVYEHIALIDYPLIKCNVSAENEKIFHLPMDQQYDRVVITPEKGEFYAKTVKEALTAGFRRAYRWTP